MASSRGLLASLVISAGVVGALTPAVVLESTKVEERADALRGPIVDASRAGKAELAEATAILDQLEPLLTGEVTIGPMTAQDILTALSAEAQTWTASERALDAAGVGAIDDSYATSRAALLENVDVLSEVYATGIVSDVDMQQMAEDSVALVATMRDQLVVLDDAIDRELIDAQVASVSSSASRVQTLVLVGMGALLAFLLGAIVVVLRTTRRNHAEATRVAAERDRTARRTSFESRLMRGLEMAKTESSVFDLVGQAIGEGVPGHDAELLVADSSRAHFRRALRIGTGDGCAVVSPLDCPATIRGQTAVFADDTSIDTCPHLRGTGCSATCVPVSVAGKTTGVVHVKGLVGAPPDGESVVALEVIARRASERIAMVRAFEQTSAQANTDALTGLANRRAVEERLREQQRQGGDYCVAYGDLDHFKLLNDHHGHDTGDRALRLFARVLRDAVRPTDLPGRFGGEEFVLVLPDCSADDAEVVLERVREQLATALASASLPPFTCSFGLATSFDGEYPEDVIAAADAALLEAKAAGRDRVVRVGERPAGQTSEVSGLAVAPPAA